MAKQKIERGIYHDERCSKNPYYVNIMVRGKTHYRKFKGLGECIESRDEFVKSMERTTTDVHDLVLRQDGMLVLEVNFSKYYPDDEEGAARALKIATVLEAMENESV